MPTIEIDGCTIRYALLGQGTPIALTPGGRFGMAAMRPLAEALAPQHQVLCWDRRNTGASDVYIGGNSEAEVAADDLAELLTRLNLAPAFVGGASAGCRTSLLTAIRHPEVVKGLVLWSASGGPLSAQNLGYQYHVPYILAAKRGGMEAVIRAGQFARNAKDEEKLRAMDPNEFVQGLTRWNEAFFYRPDMPVIGATEAQLRALRVPTIIFGSEEYAHPRSTSEAIARLIPNAELIESPWKTSEYEGMYFGGKETDVVRLLYPRLAPNILQFMAQSEVKQTAPA